MRELLQKLYAGETLVFEESERVFSELVQGNLSSVEIAALVMALKVRGEHPDEIAGAAKALRESAEFFPCIEYPVVDCCGTGGDGAHTINVSTAAAFVLAEMGVRVAKHGNRSVSSQCGSADVLERLGINVEQSPDTAVRCLENLGICFLFAPAYHKGMKFAMPVRKALATRTIFNLLGPLVNPAKPAFQIVGVYDPALTEHLAFALARLGVEGALVVHGAGLDEISIHGKTTAAIYKNRKVTTLEIDPVDMGLEIHSIEELKGGSPGENAVAIENILKGKGSRAHHLSVAINAGALMWLCGKAQSIKEGTESALTTIESGCCHDRLKAFREMSSDS